MGDSDSEGPANQNKSRLAELKARLKNSPKEDYEWLAERLQKPPALPEGNIKVRLGGLFSPGYEASYRAAWLALMHRARDLAIPILYLQRHALELTVKNTIRMLLYTREEMQLGHDVLDIAPDNHDALNSAEWNKDWKLVHTEHKFDPLLDCLARNLKLLGLPEIPPAFHKAKDLIHLLDPGDGALFRYDTVGYTRRRSFSRHPDAEPKVARISELAEHLEAIANDHSRISNDGESPISFLDEVSKRSFWVNFDVGRAVYDLEKKTRAGEVAWTVAATPRVGKNSGLDRTLRLLPRCVAAEADGRRFVMTQIDCSDPYAYHLSRDRQGELGRLLWIAEYQSNLYFAVKDSLEAKGVEMPW